MDAGGSVFRKPFVVVTQIAGIILCVVGAIVAGVDSSQEQLQWHCVCACLTSASFLLAALTEIPSVAWLNGGIMLYLCQAIAGNWDVATGGTLSGYVLMGIGLGVAGIAGVQSRLMLIRDYLRMMKIEAVILLFCWVILIVGASCLYKSNMSGLASQVLLCGTFFFLAITLDNAAAGWVAIFAGGYVQGLVLDATTVVDSFYGKSAFKATNMAGLTLSWIGLILLIILTVVLMKFADEGRAGSHTTSFVANLTAHSRSAALSKSTVNAYRTSAGVVTYTSSGSQPVGYLPSDGTYVATTTTAGGAVPIRVLADSEGFVSRTSSPPRVISSSPVAYSQSYVVGGNTSISHSPSAAILHSSSYPTAAVQPPYTVVSSAVVGNSVHLPSLAGIPSNMGTPPRRGGSPVGARVITTGIDGYPRMIA